MSAERTVLEPPVKPARPVSPPPLGQAAKRSERRDEIRGGLIAGLLAGAVLSLVMIAMNVFTGQDVWTGMKLSGYPFLREAALQPGFEPVAVLVGLLCHVAVSAGWGMLFGMIAYRMSRPATIAFGVCWGIVVWLAMFYLVLPVVGAGELAHSVPMGFAVAEHVVFGVVLAFGFLPYQLEHRLT